MNKLLKSKLKNLPPEQQEMIMKLVEENPALFKKIGDEIKQKQKEGMNETHAMTLIMAKYKAEIQKAMQK